MQLREVAQQTDTQTHTRREGERKREIQTVYERIRMLDKAPWNLVQYLAELPR